MGFEPLTSHMLSKYPPSVLHPQPFQYYSYLTIFCNSFFFLLDKNAFLFNLLHAPISIKLHKFSRSHSPNHQKAGIHHGPYQRHPMHFKIMPTLKMEAPLSQCFLGLVALTVCVSGRLRILGEGIHWALFVISLNMFLSTSSSLISKTIE